MANAASLTLPYAPAPSGASLTVPYAPARGAAPRSNFWPIAGLVAAGGAVGLGATFLVRHLMGRAASPPAPTPALPGAPTTPPTPPPTPSPVLEAIDEGSLREITARVEPMIALLYCGTTGAGALRANYEEVARAAPPGITFVAVASDVLPADTPDLQQICEQLEGLLFLKRVTPERIEELDGEDSGSMRIGGASGLAADGVLAEAVSWVSSPGGGRAPTKITYVVDVWRDIGVEPPLVVVPVGAQVQLPLIPPNPELDVQLTNIANDPVTTPEGGPWWTVPGFGQPGMVGFDARVAGTTVFTAIQGEWRKQALIRAVA